MSAVASDVRVPFLGLGPSHALVRDDTLSDFGALIEANAFDVRGDLRGCHAGRWTAGARGCGSCGLSGDDWTLVPTVAERGASLGSGAIIMGGVRIGERALVGAGAVVTADVAAGETVVDWPARPISIRA
jgi:acetyltransferase-like isoleucine patch superfamily enzyme